jgi:uncharacterized protein (DUF2252 family)
VTDSQTDVHPALEPHTDGEELVVPFGMRLEHGKIVPHLTVDERIARGKAARAEVPRSSHADFTPGALRRDPVELLEFQATDRVPELVPVRYGRMLVSPFTFYRGAALLMAADLAATPTSGLTTQVCGDAHLSNFGAYASPERHLVFGINDFDETMPGPWEWDVKRLAASFAIAGRDNQYSTKQRRATLLAVVRAYRESMREFAGMNNLDVWYAQIDIDAGIGQMLARGVDAESRKRVQANIAKARTRDSGHALQKLTTIVDGERRIISDPPLVQPIEELATGIEHDKLMEDLRSLVRGYRSTLQSDRRHLLENYQLVHAARKVVGVGSVGTRAWILLLMGRDDGDPLFLQAKEANASVMEEFVGRDRSGSHAERVVHGQHLMQASSDIFLGWEKVVGFDGLSRDYYIRQLRDWKGSAIIENMNPKVMELYAEICGRILARAHARSGDRVAIASYLGGGDVFERAIAEFAELYADQTERDYDSLLQAEHDGRITVQRGL